MPAQEKRIDAYIEKSADFAQPILAHLRDLVHLACPDVEEKIKWSFPHFDYNGEMMCSMAAFKHHCAFSFWKASIMSEPQLMENAKSETAMGHFGKITSLTDLPSDKKMIYLIKKAMELNELGIKLPPKEKVIEKKELNVPDFVLKALAGNKKAAKTFQNFSYSHRKEYLLWITEAKTDETKNKRLVTAIEWLSEGKSRDWKYKRK